MSSIVKVSLPVYRALSPHFYLSGLNAKDRKVWRMITCLLNYTCKVQQNEIEAGQLMFSFEIIHGIFYMAVSTFEIILSDQLLVFNQ